MKIKIVALALIATVVSALVWQWRSAVDSAATHRQNAAELRQALNESEAEASQARETIDALSDAVEAQRAKARQAESDRRAAEQSLDQLERDNERIKDWSDTSVPDGIRDWLRIDD